MMRYEINFISGMTSTLEVKEGTEVRVNGYNELIVEGEVVAFNVDFVRKEVA